MDEISFEQLYGSDKTKAAELFLLWANDFLDGFDGPECTIDLEKAYEFVVNLREEDFPANGGFHDASPFKKAANIYVWLHALNPFVSGISEDYCGPVLCQHKHVIATMIGYTIVQSCLKNAVLHRKDDSTITLENPIDVSDHFFGDLVEASREITPASHYKTYCLLFEALAYQANSDASYTGSRI